MRDPDHVRVSRAELAAVLESLQAERAEIRALTQQVVDARLELAEIRSQMAALEKRKPPPPIYESENGRWALKVLCSTAILCSLAIAGGLTWGDIQASVVGGQIEVGP